MLINLLIVGILTALVGIKIGAQTCIHGFQNFPGRPQAGSWLPVMIGGIEGAVKIHILDNLIPQIQHGIAICSQRFRQPVCIFIGVVLHACWQLVIVFVDLVGCLHVEKLRTQLICIICQPFQIGNTCVGFFVGQAIA